jgi:hypothetical protein
MFNSKGGKTMKNTYRYITIMFLCALFSSCDLTLIPEDTVSPDDYFQSESDLKLWTNSFYTMLDSPDAARYNADDMVDKAMGNIISGTRMPSDDADGLNEWNWEKLRHINYLLQHSSNCKDAEVRAHYEGVAYFFRAYCYFEKVMRYGDVPWYDQVLNSTDDELLKKAREDRETVMDHVMSDLDSAIAKLPAAHSVSTVTKWTALALKSRAGLFEGTWREYRGLSDYEKFLTAAAAAARTFISESGYKLNTTGSTPYRDLFDSDDANTDETILARIYNFETLNLSNSLQFNIRNDAQGFTRRFMDHYLMADGSRFTDRSGYQTMTYTEETKNRDPRMAQTVLCPGYMMVDSKTVTPDDMTSMTGYEPIKYVASAAHSGASKGTNDYILFRTAEVYLNYAEALAELGTLTQGDLDISVNLLRDRVKMPHMDIAAANSKPDSFLESCYPNVTKSADTGVILEIRRERTVELVLEGFRQWDMLRWKEGAQMVNATNPYYGMYFPGAGLYDMDQNGTNDLEIYATTQTSKPADGLTVLKLGSDIVLSQGDKGYVVAYPSLTYTWNEDRDYLWPIPADQRVLTGGILTQNPGWEDGLSF